MNRKILFSALWLLTVGCVSVQSQTDRQQAVLTAALNSNDAYELELSYHRGTLSDYNHYGEADSNKRI